MSKILILQSSPRAKGNTAWMTEEYKQAAEAAGHEVTVVNVARKKVNGCIACEYCHTKGNGQCVQKDDMQELYPLLAEAEVLVLASPINYFTFNAQMHAVIDRLYPTLKPANVKKMALMLSSYSPGVYEPAIKEYEMLCSFWQFENMGIVTAMNDEQKTDATAQKIKDLVTKL